jgi:hypothetical protein
MFPSPTSSFSIAGKKRNFAGESRNIIIKKTSSFSKSKQQEAEKDLPFGTEDIVRDNDNIWGDSDTESMNKTSTLQFSTPIRVSSRVGRTMLLVDSDTESESSELDSENAILGLQEFDLGTPDRVRFGRMKAVNRELSTTLKCLAESALSIADCVDGSLLNIDEPFFQNNRKRMAILSAEVTCKHLSESLSQVSSAHHAIAQLLITLMPKCDS